MNAHSVMSKVGDRSVRTMPALLKDRRAWLSRLAFRAPLMLYRVGLGGLLGHQFLVVTHAGRRTGHVHETVLKVLHYEPATCESVVASAWGAEADWYRNLQVRPALAVRTAGLWYVPETRTLKADEAFAVFADWMRRQHRFADLMLGQIGLSWDVPAAEQHAIVAGIPFIAFRPSATPGVVH